MYNTVLDKIGFIYLGMILHEHVRALNISVNLTLYRENQGLQDNENLRSLASEVKIDICFYETYLQLRRFLSM